MILEEKNINFYVNWKEYEKEVKSIGDLVKKEKNLEEIIAIKRGGLIGGVILSHYLSLPLRVINIDELLSNVCKYQNVKVLLWDDVSDNGNTFTIAQDNLKKFYTVIISASVYIAEGTCFVPNYYSKILPKNYWVVFPWENKNTGESV